MMGRTAYATPDQGVATAVIRREVRQVTSKRQVTLPKEFFDAAGIGSLVEITYDDEARTLVLRPYNADDWHTAEHIIADLAAEGVSADQMAAAYAQRKAEIEAAICRACGEVHAELAKNPDAGKDHIAARLKELGQE